MYVSGEGTEADPYVHNVDIYYEEDGSERPSNVSVSYVGHNTFVADGDGIVSYNGDTYHHAGGYHTVRMTQCNGCPDPVTTVPTIDPSKGEQLPDRPSHGQKAELVLDDGSTVTLTYDAEYDAWLAPELDKLINDENGDIILTKPQFQGDILAAMTPVLVLPAVGEAAVGAAAIVVGTVFVYEVADFYLTKGFGKRNIWPDQFGTPPRVGDIDWTKGDGQLANDTADEYGDPDRGLELHIIS